MRRDGGGHSHGDAGGPIDQQVRDGGGQHGRFLERVVKVGSKVHRVLVQIGQQLDRDGRQTGFGVAHRGGTIAINRAKIPLPIHQRGAQAKILGHTGHRVVHRRVAVGMVLAQHLANDAGRFLVRRVGPQVQVVHSVEDTALDRLEAVAGVGQGTRDDDAHRIVHVCLAHFNVNVYLTDGANFHNLTPMG